MSHITEHLADKGYAFELLRPDTDTTTHHEGLDPGQLVKTVVLDVRTGHAFAVLPADRDVDLDAVRTAIDSTHVGFASDAEIARDYPEFESGAIPPLGALVRTPLIVDSTLLERDTVVFATGSSGEAVRMSTRDLFASAMMKVAPITHEARELTGA